MMVACCPLSSPDECYENSEERWEIWTADKSPEGAECCECGCAFSTGDRVQVTVGWQEDDDGDFDEWSTCATCHEIRDHFACDGFNYGQLWNDLQESFFPDMKMGGPCMAGLSPAAKLALVDARMEWLYDSAGDYGVNIVALPPWWRWWYGDADPGEGRH